MKMGFLWNATCPKEIWSIFWDPYIRNTDVVGCEYCVSDLGGSGIGMLTVPAEYLGLVKVGSEHVFPDPIVDNNVFRLAGLPDGVKMSATVLSGKHGKQPATENGTVGSSRDCGYEPLFSETSRFEDVVKGKSTAAYGCDSGGLQVRFSEQSPDSIFLIYELGRGGAERVWDFKKHSNRGWE